METRPDPKATPSWWGSFPLPEGEVRHWRIGPSLVWIERRSFEWRVHHRQLEDPVDASLEIDVGVAPEDIDPAAQLRRFSFGRPGRTLALAPRLADRPVIVRPETPFFVPSGEDVTMYVSTPLWIQLKADDAVLTEFPSYRPSDTWFGPSTREGELCYASRTTGTLAFADLLFRPHRAATPIRIRNQARDALLLERIRLPVQYLSLYRGERAFLWTQLVTLTREHSGDMAGLQLGTKAPTQAGKATQVAVPREKADRNLVVRAFSRLFSAL